MSCTIIIRTVFFRIPLDQRRRMSGDDDDDDEDEDEAAYAAARAKRAVRLQQQRQDSPFTLDEESTMPVRQRRPAIQPPHARQRVTERNEDRGREPNRVLASHNTETGSGSVGGRNVLLEYMRGRNVQHEWAAPKLVRDRDMAETIDPYSATASSRHARW
jgi:hypothetical protein